jgi:hypothetical protein
MTFTLHKYLNRSKRLFFLSAFEYHPFIDIQYIYVLINNNAQVFQYVINILGIIGLQNQIAFVTLQFVSFPTIEKSQIPNDYELICICLFHHDIETGSFLTVDNFSSISFLILSLGLLKPKYNEKILTDVVAFVVNENDFLNVFLIVCSYLSIFEMTLFPNVHSLLISFITSIASIFKIQPTNSVVYSFFFIIV